MVTVTKNRKKNLKNLLLRNRWREFNEIWHVASATIVLSSLFKWIPSVNIWPRPGVAGVVNFTNLWTITSNDIFSETTGSIMLKLGSNDPCMTLYKVCVKNVDPPKTLVTMATERKIFENIFLLNIKYNRDLWRKQNTDNVKYCRSGLIGPVHEWQWIVECCHSRHLAPGWA